MTCSEHFSTIPFPEKMAARIGDHALCRAAKGQLTMYVTDLGLLTIVPRHNSSDYAEGLVDDL